MVISKVMFKERIKTIQDVEQEDEDQGAAQTDKDNDDPSSDDKDSDNDNDNNAQREEERRQRRQHFETFEGEEYRRGTRKRKPRSFSFLQTKFKDLVEQVKDNRKNQYA